MADDRFGVQLHELAALRQEWHSASERMAGLSERLDAVRTAVTRAAAVDLAAGALGGVAGIATAYRVLEDVREIEKRAEALARTQKQLTEELAADAAKLRAVADEYAAADRRIHEEMRKKHRGEHHVPAPPRTGTDHAGGSGSGGGHAGGGAAGGSGAGSGSGSFDGQGDGKWRTVGSWDAWSPGRHHTTRGAGVITGPDLSGLPDARRQVLERALERINHRIGYSQSATTNGYRDDCSGFVSAAWGLEPPGLNTYGLMGSGCAHPISKDELRPGDALIAGDHTVLFGGWADAAHTKYIALEDNGSQGTVSHVIPYPYFSGDAAHERAIGHPYVPYRRNGL
ncbi:hypothetical protein [Streptomyces sp. NPDC001380]|uniref:hypothetical protein n=1 Tax=Streptomyces sp. NPDC001380 TaxID=3364566 RepID=UPI00367F5C5C